MFIRSDEAYQRKQMFLICRYILIFATGALAYSEVGKEASPMPIALLVILASISNLVLGTAEPFSFFDPRMQAPVIVSDTAMVSVALLLTRASQESFLFFFFVLIMAAKLENLVTLGICAVAIGFASFIMTVGQAGWEGPALMRVPFTFASALFFGYVVLPERSGQMLPFTFSGAAPGAKHPTTHSSGLSRSAGRGPASSHRHTPPSEQ